MKIRFIFLLFFLIFGWASQAQQISTQPKINGPRLYGASPGKEFIYTIPASGARPMQFEVKNLPKGVKINKANGVISGVIKKAGEYTIELLAQNKFGKARKSFTLVIGDKLALTPPMGWSSWYSFGRNVTLDKVIRSAEIIKEKGLQNYGWSVIEIDDPWTNQPDKNDSVWNQLQSGEKAVYGYYEGPDNLPERKGKMRRSKWRIIAQYLFYQYQKFPDNHA